MKIRTETELFEHLSQYISWRISDISRLKKAILLSRDNKLHNDTLLRASIPILYAHWEGFVKEAATAYYSFISTKRLLYSELNSGMLSKFIENEFLTKTTATRFGTSKLIVDFFNVNYNNRSDNYKVPEPINTKSNLNSEVLREIFEILDLNYATFRAYEVFIDSKLLKARNKIAHGEYKTIDFSFYSELHDFVLFGIRAVKDEIENNVVLRNYRRVTA